MPASFSAWVGLMLLITVLLILAGVGIHGAIGLFQSRSLIRREFTAFFLSPIAYIVMAVFLVVFGYLFVLTLRQLTAIGPRGVEFPLQYMIGEQWLFWLVFLIIPPLLTMRLFAEERGSGTLELLMTAPVRDWQLVLSKYVACYAFYLILWLPTLIYVPLLVDAGAPVWTAVWTPASLVMMTGFALTLVGLGLVFVPGGNDVRLLAILTLVPGVLGAVVGAWCHYSFDSQYIIYWPVGIATGWAPVLCTYLGVLLAGAMLLAIGLFISSLVRSQLVAALVSLALGLVFIVAGFWQADIDTGTTLGRALFFVSIPQHFSRDFTRGLIDTRHVTLYLSVTVFALFLTVRSLEARRWR